MECPYCKTDNRDDVRICSSCGKYIAALTPSANSSGISRSLTPGSRLQGGRYIVKRILGQGGMGAALLAEDIRLDSKPVVIKELISDSVDSEKLRDDVRNFKREVATLAHIDHPLVPNVTDHFQEGMRYFMVQEYVEGENLDERLARTRQLMLERDVLVCASEVLDILDYLAQQTSPIVHRDIKPANIIVGAKDRRAHLVDFGIARAEVVRNAQRKQTSALGTPGYAPPEQYQGNADPRSDLYALAATLHHVLTNRDPRNYPPFTYPPLRAVNPQASPETERILIRALMNDINQRYQSAIAMKQAVDGVLQQRFGLSGNINSYVLGSGSSGPMQPISSYNTTVIAGTSPGRVHPSSVSAQTPVPTSLMPVIASSSPQPVSLPATPANSLTYPPSVPVAPSHIPTAPARRQGSQKRRSMYLLLTVVALILILVGVFTNLYRIPALFGGSGNGIGVTKVGNNEYVGISDGRYAFDTGRPGGPYKVQATQHLLQNSDDTSTAMAFLNQAIAQDTNDAEALIYMENLNVLNSDGPYIDLVVATMLSGDPAVIGVGRDNLQGAYIAQKEFNDGAKLKSGVKVRLLIANSGGQTEFVTRVAQQIVQLAKSDTHFVGVMGWPYSSRSVNAVPILRAAHIPMVSQTSSSDLLTNTSSYFFRVAPSNLGQGIAGARYVSQTLKAKNIVLFFDPADPYSQSLAQDFAREFKADTSHTIVEEHYVVDKPETITARVQDALDHKPDLIYFSGYAREVSTLLTNLPAGDLHVMGGDALYSLGGYPSSARPLFNRLRFTAFAYPDEWDVLGYGGQKPAFFTEYPAAFDPHDQHPGGSYGFSRADNDTILSYDATVALLKGCNISLNAHPEKITVTPEELRLALKQIKGANAVQGVSGQIAFGDNGDPVDKAIVILYVDQDGHIKMEPIPLGRFLK